MRWCGRRSGKCCRACAEMHPKKYSIKTNSYKLYPQESSINQAVVIICGVWCGSRLRLGSRPCNALKIFGKFSGECDGKRTASGKDRQERREVARAKPAAASLSCSAGTRTSRINWPSFPPATRGSTNTRSWRNASASRVLTGANSGPCLVSSGPTPLCPVPVLRRLCVYPGCCPTIRR